MKFMVKSVAILLFVSFLCVACGDNVYRASDYGILPNSGEDVTQAVASLIAKIKDECKGEPATLVFDEGDYEFNYKSAAEKEYYISNHEQVNPKPVAIVLEDISNLTIDGSGSNFFMTGRILPVAIKNCTNFTMKNLAIDNRTPQITQITILDNNERKGVITYRISSEAKYRIDENGRLITYGDNWEIHPVAGIAFEAETGRMVYQTSDIAVGTNNVVEIEPYVIKAPWNNPKLKVGDVVALRDYGRPTPGIFLADSKDVTFVDVTVSYAEGMGLLAQLTENITLDGFSVKIRKGTNRYFTTQADATHFSACKGKIVSRNAIYESMMDDAINVHGTYLRVTEQIDSTTVIGKYMHHQAYGFYWGGEGDSVQFVNSRTMEVVSQNVIASINPYDTTCINGAKLFKIEFKESLPADVANGNYGIENLMWTPEVVFADNVIRNNRARGALFSTPRKVVVERNLFDHTSGTAILLCGDCNGWFETGACRNVVIRNNHFINALTNMFQFTNAIISIYPEIPDLASQKSYFHGGKEGGVIIENNTFETFDNPIVYAKSLDGLIFRNNTIIPNNDYTPFHWNKYKFMFEKVDNVQILDNDFRGGFDENTDVLFR